MPLGEFLRMPQALTLPCRNCGARLKLDRRSLLGFDSLGGLLLMLGVFFWLLRYMRFHFPLGIATPCLVIAAIGLLYAVKAWCWRVYRYTLESAQAAKVTAR